jgi:hypothetical protein
MDRGHEPLPGIYIDGQLAHLHPKAHVLAHCHVVEEGKALEHKADVPVLNRQVGRLFI